MMVPLSRHLTRFSAPAYSVMSGSKDRAIKAEPIEAIDADEPPILSEPLVTLAAADLGARIETAAEEARAAALEACEHKIAALERDHLVALETTMVAARQDWATKEGDRLRAQLEDGLAAMREALGDGVAAALCPLVERSLADRMLANFAEALDQLLADPARSLITVRGSADLIAALQAGRDLPARVTFEIGEGAELSMTADEAHVESRLAEAFASLAPGAA